MVGFLCLFPLYRLGCLPGIPPVYSGVVALAPIIFVFINCFSLPIKKNIDRVDLWDFDVLLILFLYYENL